MASRVADEATASTAGRSKPSLYSDVWDDFEYNAADGGVAAAATATCRWCGKTLCAGGTNGTSHLRRHTKRCRARAAEDEEGPSSVGEQEQEEEEDQFYFVDGVNIPWLFDKLLKRGLVHIDQGEGDAHFWPILPQAASTSSRRFFQKTKERVDFSRKKTESKKRCIRDEFSQGQLSDAQQDFNLSFGEKRMLANSNTSGDYSRENNK